MTTLDDNNAPARPDGFELTYRLELADYVAFLRSVPFTKLERFYGRLAAFGAGATGGVAGLLLWVFVGSPLTGLYDDFSLFTFLGVTALIVVFGHLRVLAPAYLKTVFAGQSLGGSDIRLTADAEGLQTATERVRVGNPWKTLALVETPAHFFFYFTRLNAQIVPKAAFAHAGDADAFAAFARSRMTGDKPA